MEKAAECIQKLREIIAQEAGGRFGACFSTDSLLVSKATTFLRQFGQQDCDDPLQLLAFNCGKITSATEVPT